MNAHHLPLLLIGLLVAGGDDTKKAAEKDLAAMQGEWKAEWAEFDDKKLESIPEANRFITVQGDKCYNNGRFAFSIKLHPQFSPKLIDVAAKGEIIEGLYRIEADTLVWCWSVKQGQKSRPLSFESAKGSEVLLVSHSRVKR